MAQVWYPARKGSSSSHAPYLPDADAVTTAEARLHNLPDFSFTYLTYVTTNAAASVPVADDQPSYPVLMYLEGLTGYRQLSTFQVEELVSHGYIVVGIDLKACLVMDVAMTADVVQRGLRQPSMWITRPADTMRLERQEDGGWSEQAIQQTQSTMRAVYTRLPGDGYFVQVPGMFHIDFTDLDLLTPIFIPGFSGGPIGSQRAHEIVNAYSLAFFDKHLKGEPQALLDGPVAPYPEVIFEKRGP